MEQSKAQQRKSERRDKFQVTWFEPNTFRCELKTIAPLLDLPFFLPEKIIAATEVRILVYLIIGVHQKHQKMCNRDHGPPLVPVA